MGEFELIQRVRERLRAAGADRSAALVLGSGDDAAITLPGDRACAISVDAYVDGVHFRRENATLASIGSKALAGALSDIAAMGAVPGEVYVTIVVPANLDEAGCVELVDGLAQAAADWGAALAGGDVVRGPALMLSLTAVGYADTADQLVKRAGAAPGDSLVVSGELGGSAAGLLLLEQPQLAGSVEKPIAQALVDRHREPAPRLQVGRALASCGATAMIDLSDGLAGDAQHLAEASAIKLEIAVADLPLQEGVAEVAAAAEREPVELALGGGEDYELLACLPPRELARAESEVAKVGSRLTRIGRVLRGLGVELIGATDAARSVAGYDQLRPRASGDVPV